MPTSEAHAYLKLGILQKEILIDEAKEIKNTISKEIHQKKMLKELVVENVKETEDDTLENSDYKNSIFQCFDFI